MALLSLGNLGAKFSETSFPHFKTYFTQICRCHLYSLDNNFLKKFNCNNNSVFGCILEMELYLGWVKSITGVPDFEIFSHSYERASFNGR